jgi:hypothetical protein
MVRSFTTVARDWHYWKSGTEPRTNAEVSVSLNAVDRDGRKSDTDAGIHDGEVTKNPALGSVPFFIFGRLRCKYR